MTSSRRSIGEHKAYFAFAAEPDDHERQVPGSSIENAWRGLFAPLKHPIDYANMDVHMGIEAGPEAAHERHRAEAPPTRIHGAGGPGQPFNRRCHFKPASLASSAQFIVDLARPWPGVMTLG